MPMFDKNIKAHKYAGDELVNQYFDQKKMLKLSKLIDYIYYKYFTSGYQVDITAFLGIHFGIKVREIYNFLKKAKLKDLLIILEYITKYKLSYSKTSPFAGLAEFKTFLEEFNNFFLLNELPFQIVFIPQKEEFYVEKIIDEYHSQEIKSTLQKFSAYDTIFEDFKNAIISFSSGDYHDSIKKCCISLEDYFCVILDRKSCRSIDKFYLEVAKKLAIPDDINERFKTIINLIHSYRSKPLHGAKTKTEQKDIYLINKMIIGFTIIILNYVFEKFERI